MKKIPCLLIFLFLFCFTTFSQLKSFTIDELLKESDELFISKRMPKDSGLYAVGDALYQAGRYDSASIAFSACIIKNPLYTDAYYYRGLSFMYTKQLDFALNDFDVVIKFEPQSEGAYLNKGITCSYKGDYVNSLKCYDKTILINSQNGWAYYYRANVKSQMKYPDNEILKDYDQVIKMKDFDDFSDNQKGLIYNNKAYILVQKGILDEALKLVNIALKYDKTKWFIWDTRGEIYFKQKKFVECINDMSQAIEIDESLSDNSFYYRGLAKIKSKIDGCPDLKQAFELGKKEAQSEIAKSCK